MVIKASAPVKKKQGENVLPKQRALKLAKDQFTKKIRDSAQTNDVEQQDRPASNFAVDSTRQAAQFVGDKAMNGGMQKAKITIQQRQNFIKERKAQAAEKKAQVVEAVHREQDIDGTGSSHGVRFSSAENRAGVYHGEPHVRTGIDPVPSTPQPKYAVHDPVQRPANERGFSQVTYGETPVRKTEPFTHHPIATNSNLHKNQSIHRSVQPPTGEAGRSSIKEHNSGAFTPKEKPVRGPSAIKSRRAEETVKNLTDPIKTDMISFNTTFPKPGDSVKPGKSTAPRHSAGKALMERAARKMKLHSQKQLAQKAGKTAKATGAATKKAAVVTVRAARALISALAGLVGGTGVFILLAVVLLGGALSAFGASPGTGIYTPVSAEVTETIDQFTQWHKAENPETPLHIERLDLAELLAVCLMEQAHLFCNAGVEPEVELPDQPIYIYSDKGACRRILENLLTNAHRHTTGQVYIKLDPPGEFVHLVVANQAEGLKPEEVPLLFQRFYQYDSARSKGGSGLGLAIVKALTERLGAGLDAGVERGWFWVQIKL